MPFGNPDLVVHTPQKRPVVVKQPPPQIFLTLRRRPLPRLHVQDRLHIPHNKVPADGKVLAEVRKRVTPLHLQPPTLDCLDRMQAQVRVQTRPEVPTVDLVAAKAEKQGAVLARRGHLLEYTRGAWPAFYTPRIH